MNNKNYTIKTLFPTFIAAEINKKSLTSYSRVENEVGSVAVVVFPVVAVAVVAAAVAVCRSGKIVAVSVAGAPDIAVFVVVVTDVFVPSSFDDGADVENADVGVGIIAVIVEEGVVADNSSEVCN